MNNKWALYPNNTTMILKIFRFLPSYIFLSLLNGIILGFNSILTTMYSFALLNYIEQNATIKKILYLFLSYFVWVVLFHLYTKWYSIIFRPKAIQKIKVKLHEELFRKAIKVDISCYDDPTYYNEFIISMDQAHIQTIGLIEDIVKLIQFLISSFSLAAIMIYVDFYLAFTVIILSFCRIILRRYRSKFNMLYVEEKSKIKREELYIDRVFRLPQYAIDIRITEIGSVFINRLDSLMHTKIQFEKKIFKNRFWIDFFLKLVDCLGIFFPVVFVLYGMVVRENITLGAISIAITGLWQMSRFMSGLIDLFQKNYEHELFSKKVNSFLEFTGKVKEGERAICNVDSINIKNVSFRYYPQTPYVLKNINISVKSGEKIALVGYNGAGKTTLIKLLLGLYDVTEGEIFINGMNIKEYQKKEIFEKFSIVFQDSTLFPVSIAENIVGGFSNECMEDSIFNVLNKVNFLKEIKSFPHSIYTSIGKEFNKDGIVLSVGQKQKILVGRSFYKNSQILIFDEPTSSLDSITEHLLNEIVFSNNKTTILISHRLSTTKRADKIYLLENGCIIEEGSHDELMKINGKYAHLFNLQAEQYRKNGD